MRLTKFLGRKCKVCMRILLLKSLFLGTNCPSFLPILCGFLFVSAVESFLFLPWMSFYFCRGYLLFLPWNPFCFCRGCLCVYSFFLFVFSSLVPSIFSHEIRKTWEFFWKKSIVFRKKSIVFLKISIVFWGLLSNV